MKRFGVKTINESHSRAREEKKVTESNLCKCASCLSRHSHGGERKQFSGDLQNKCLARSVSGDLLKSM